MTLSLIPNAAALALVAAASFGASASAAPDPLAAYRGKNRVVIALANAAADPGVADQRRLFAGMRPGARERDLVLVEATSDTAEGRALQRRFGFSGGFRAILVGKDGGEKFAADRPIGPADLFPLIDAMPMRQDEMRGKP